MPKTIFITICSVFVLFTLTLGAGAELKGDGEHVFYLYRESSGCKIVRTTEEKADEFIYFKQSLKGESAELKDEERAAEIIEKLGAKEVFSESGDGFYNRYYYTPKISRYVILRGRKINLHLAVGNKVSVGSPLIFGSY
ncbi:MAG TPA: hypothetical protein DDW54_04480 [Clostridiales bacterium]|nr:hypothetical protein [Clostridiales bacterium]